MRCSDMEARFMEYLDGRARPAARRGVEEHLAACAACRARAEQFRDIWKALADLPDISPSASFDADLRARIAAEPVRRGIWSWLPSPRFSLAVAALVIFSIWISSMPQAPNNQTASNQAAAEADFRMIRDLPVLENYDVLSKFDALSELPQAPDAAGPGASQDIVQ
jgi:anti-sigma factor RsiW